MNEWRRAQDAGPASPLHCFGLILRLLDEWRRGGGRVCARAARLQTCGMCGYDAHCRGPAGPCITDLGANVTVSAGWVVIGHRCVLMWNELEGVSVLRRPVPACRGRVGAGGFGDRLLASHAAAAAARWRGMSLSFNCFGLSAVIAGRGARAGGRGRPPGQSCGEALVLLRRGRARALSEPLLVLPRRGQCTCSQ
jgi:hypothetical protein